MNQVARYQAILSAFEGQIYVIASNFRLEYINNHLLRHIGHDAVGQKCYRAIHGRDRPCSFCVMEKVLAGETVRFEVKNPRDGRWYYSMNAPVANADGTISMLAMITDIDDRKRAEEALREREEKVRRENLVLRSRIRQGDKFGNIVGRSVVMQRVYEQILNAAASDATVIVYGEPGTGKELVARAIHETSLRKDKRFVPVHCGAIPENLIESEFFGYKKGAFSGALADKPGYLDYADGGTLFLDEIGEISQHLQVKLLRVIEGGGYTPVGSSRLKNPDVRIVAATNRDLRQSVKDKQMREDFFYRIHILPIRIPPLRQRKEDLPLLVDHFMGLYAGKRNVTPLGGRDIELLMSHDWPGNVRELQNVIIRYCSQNRLEFSALARRPEAKPAAAVLAGQPVAVRGDLAAMVAAYEKRLLLDALRQNRWHRTKVARLLKIDRKTLFNKMKKHGLLNPGNAD